MSENFVQFCPNRWLGTVCSLSLIVCQFPIDSQNNVDMDGSTS